MGSIPADGQGHLLTGGGEIVTVVPEQGQSPKVIAQPNTPFQGSGVAYPNGGAGLDSNSFLGKALQQAQQQRVISPVSQPQAQTPTQSLASIMKTSAYPTNQNDRISFLNNYFKQNPQALTPYLNKYRAMKKAKGGRVHYADGSMSMPSQQQLAMVVTMLKKGADVDTISSMVGMPAEQVQMIVSKIQQSIQQRTPGGITNAQTALAHGGIPSGSLRKNQHGIHEIDYRKKGGYVPPIGVKEKADDIPAMLSNNEFVFTANAVRNAGGGDVKAGAKKMYALMKHLEGKK